MYKKRMVGLVCSMFLHTSLFVYLIFPPLQIIPSQKQEQDEPKPVSVKLIPMEKPSEDADILKGNKDALSYPTDPEICSGLDKTYRGVGVMSTFGSNMIVYAPEFYPGYKAGLRIGDYIVNDAREVNGYIDFEIRRGYTALFFHIKTDNICYNDG